MKASPGMQTSRILLHIFLMVLLLSNHQVHGVTCSVEVMIKRQSRYTGKSGQVATIECPVKYCHEKPSMSWCKVEGNDCLPLQTRETYTKWTEDTIFVLTFSSVHRNDSGLYRCQAISGNISSVSHSVNVTILEGDTSTSANPSTNTTSIQQNPQGYKNDNMKWIIYGTSSLGALFLLILICLCCLKWHKVKSKTTPATSQTEINMVNSPTDVQSYINRTPAAQNEGATFDYCIMKSQLQLPDGSAVYDNDVPHWNGHGAEPRPACDKPAIPSKLRLTESLDSIVYASLNHSAVADNFLPRELDVNIELTEYAAINVKK
ncbi:B- and T-lymphocyte attenuator [Alligator mississippiensis]|nr:B- and T-lymphocyte attenuator [Alligator mississippiensis]